MAPSSLYKSCSHPISVRLTLSESSMIKSRLARNRAEPVGAFTKDVGRQGICCQKDGFPDHL